MHTPLFKYSNKRICCQVNTLVIVTCCKDYWKFEMLCKSLNLFLEPAKIIIIINEDDSYVPIWKSFYNVACKNHLGKHTVQIYTRADLYGFEIPYMHIDGWVHQQVLKLFAAQVVDDDEYLVLDSKNFLFRKTSVENIKQTEPTTDWMLPPVERFCIECCNFFNVKYTGRDMFYVTQNITPFILQTSVVRDLVKHFQDKKHFYSWFQNLSYIDGVAPTEFIVYEVFAKKLGKEKTSGLCTQNSCTIWQHTLLETEKHKHVYRYVLQQAKLYDIKVSGFHGGVHDILDDKTVKYIIKNLGLGFILPTYAESPFLG